MKGERIIVPEKRSEIRPGTIRITASRLNICERTKTSWRRSSRVFPEAMLVIKLFKKNNRFPYLMDKNDPRFLKGQLAPNGMCQGARIGILPNGKKLSKAFPLFAPNLMIHDEKTQHHWDVIYKNPGGTYSYLYTAGKVKMRRKKKYHTVKEFEKYYPIIKANAHEALNDEDDHLAVPMYTLLKTCMRVGNQIYYALRRHKGLTTMKKKDIEINGAKVSFNYIGKGGVPTSITEIFPRAYIERLKDLLRRTNKSSFVFINGNTGRPINEDHFRAAFKRYCGREFYPHIVRSFYATNRVKKFLATRKAVKKKDVSDLFYSIAEKLGHKRFIKKNRSWREDYRVTINHYVQPEILEKVKRAVEYP
jgi:DNA topoisomerase IB